jgi:twitching motility protein PilT
LPKLDFYLANLKKYNAAGVQLVTGKRVVFEFPSGNRAASQTVKQDALMAMLDEVVPDESMAALLLGKPLNFVHKYEAREYTVRVSTSGDVWRVIVRPSDADDTDSVDVDVAEPGSVAAASPPPPGLDQTGPFPKASPAGARPVAAKADAAVPSATAPSAVATASDSEVGIDPLLRECVRLGVSDLHLSSESPPFIRSGGKMTPMQGYPTIGAEQMAMMLGGFTPEKYWQDFEEKRDADFAHAIPGVARFRVNLFYDRHGPGAVIRTIPFQILTPEQIGLPDSVKQLCDLTKGLVLVTGPTGSGKSTTLATMIDMINRHRETHIITIEDPIESVHPNKKSLINQREVGEHTESFGHALRAALREDPDIVLVGELRDLETTAIALETAETGHLVFGTLHTTTAPGTVDRLVNQFPANQQEQMRQMLADTLRGVIAQNLCSKKGGGRVAAYEVLISSKAVGNLIREKKTFQLFSMMQTGRGQGMVTLNGSLLELIKKGLVEPKEAYYRAASKAEFKSLLDREGISLE